jgi:TRAP-type C4-dicarboxylate transport system permease small subunit
MHELQRTNVSPVVGISMIWVYGIGYVVSVVMGIINLNKLWRLATGRVSDEELVQVMESEDVAHEPAAAAPASGTAGGAR